MQRLRSSSSANFDLCVLFSSPTETDFTSLCVCASAFTEHKICYSPEDHSGCLSEVAFFISLNQVRGHCFSINDGQHRYRLLNHQFLIVSQLLLPQGQQSLVFTVQSSPSVQTYAKYGLYRGCLLFFAILFICMICLMSTAQ